MENETPETPLQLHLSKILKENERPIVENIYTLSADESARYPEAELNVKSWIQTDIETFLMLEDAYSVFLDTVDSVKVKLESNNPVPSVREELIRINSAFLSLLSLGRLYVDHTCSKIGSNRAAELAAFKAATSTEFDNMFAYRFFYQLRNYAQHRGLPLTGLNASGKINLDTQEAEYSFELYFIKGELISYRSIWSQKVLPDLQDSPGSIMVLPLVEEYMESMKRIRQEALKLFTPIINNDVEFLVGIISRASGQRPIYMVNFRNKGVIGENVIADAHMREVPVELVGFLDPFRKK